MCHSDLRNVGHIRQVPKLLCQQCLVSRRVSKIIANKTLTTLRREQMDIVTLCWWSQGEQTMIYSYINKVRDWHYSLNNLCFVSSVIFHMMTSSNDNIFRVTGHLCGEFTGDRWIPSTKDSDAEPWCFLWINGWVNNRDAGGLRRYYSHYDLTVMISVTINACQILNVSHFVPMIATFG